MARETLRDFFDDIAADDAVFLTYDNGYRSWNHTYRHTIQAARAFAGRLAASGMARGDKIIVWGENRPEWVVALWGCVLQGVVLVPIDYRASAELLRRIERIVSPRAVLIGDEVTLEPTPGGPPVWRLSELPWSGPPPASFPALDRDDVVEIIFTSGATADPKGVVITHRNILANIVPIEREIRRYRKWGRPFRPIRFLNLLPLSHMFGQAMATFIPPILPGVVVFMRGYNPGEIVRQIQTRRVSVLVCVPKILEVLRDHVLRLAPELATASDDGAHWLVRWWRYRRVHRMFGLKFWSFVVGAAPLDPSLEAFWKRLGFVVVQGYGLTETAPIVTLNHPFRARSGSVGTPIAGVEVRIAPDGEILVRGENVTSGYYGAERETREAFEGGWFHTGDIGAVDEEGRLRVLGRKKEMIVTPEGLNVFPEDIERRLIQQTGVRDAAVVGDRRSGAERVHAVVILAPGADTTAIVRTVNAQLEDHQKIRDISVWPGDALPRTEGTRKLKRVEIRAWVEGRSVRPTGGDVDPLADVLARFAGSRALEPGTTLEELGLSSLERLELMMALEERFQTTIDESALGASKSLQELRTVLHAPGPAGPAPAAESLRFPSWNRSAPVALVRRLSLPTWILPLARAFAWIEVQGREHLRDLQGPVVFAANHQSHMDTPVILAALPARYRYRTATAMAKEFFTAHFYPEGASRRQWFTNSLNYYLAAFYFSAFPIPQREAGTRETLRYMGELIADGQSILIYPEGRRTERGEISEFRAGIGMIGSRLDVPVVPVRIDGLQHVLHLRARMARPGRVRVAIGPPIRLTGENYEELADRVRTCVLEL